MYVILLTWQFRYWLLIGYMKTPAMLKRQQFEDSGSEETEPRGSKYHRLYAHGDKKEEGLDKFEGKDEGKAIGYVPLSFVASPQKESNRPTGISKETMSLNHLV